MSNFIGKIGEKLHIGGHKKEGEQELPPQQIAHEGQHPPHAGDCKDHGHGQPQAGYVEPLGSHPDPVYGGEHHTEVAGYEQHGEQHGTGVDVPHEGPLEKVKNKIKGQKQDGKEDGSSSSSSESDGEGNRRRKQKPKKHGIF